VVYFAAHALLERPQAAAAAGTPPTPDKEPAPERP
jgi:hypothetical protein